MRYRHLALLVSSLLLVLIAAAPNKTPNVTVTKSDGTVIRGQLNSSDLKGISVTKLIKNQPSGEAVTIPWAEVRSVSNGLTRQRTIEQWKKEHPEDLCDTCRGTGKGLCPTCKGGGRDHASAKDCPTCHGEQTVPCTTPKCDHGKIPCPRPCLKLTEGTWVKKPDGVRWRKVSNGRGQTGEVSEHHLGQILEVKDGSFQEPVECPTCQGKMVIDDPKCRGSGALPCNTCSTAAAKDAAQKCHDCERGMIACKTCGGSGLKSLTTQPAE